MGLFGSTKTYVSSVLYNLAGDVADRPNYLKTLTVGNVITNSKFSMAETLKTGYLHGPGIKLRSFFRWCQDNYDYIGMPEGHLGGVTESDLSDLEDAILGVDPGPVFIQALHFGIADYSFWADQWMLDNHPTLIDTAWVSDINETTGDITVTFEDTSTSTFTPTDFVGGAEYLYATYLLDDVTGIYIYRIGSGNPSLDSLAADEVPDPDGEYFPFIPIRLDNEFLSTTFEPDGYALAKKAYKKAGGGSFDDLIAKIEDNADLDDIDFAYVVYGVPLNTASNEGKEYLYRFFDRIRVGQIPDEIDITTYIGEMEDYNAEYSTYQEAQMEWVIGGKVGPRPTYPTTHRQTSPKSYITIRSTGDLDTNFHNKISWRFIGETTGVGLKEVGRVPGEIWLEDGGLAEQSLAEFTVDDLPFSTDFSEGDVFTISWQVDDDNWKMLTISGAKFENRIYNGKSVVIKPSEAFDDEDESGFLVPLHYETIREMSLINSTQLATQCAFVVFNCYEVVKTKWYQSFIFKIILVVVIIAITVLTGGVGASGIGLLGTNLAVGAALGLSGTLAVIAGAIANAIAAMIIMKIVTFGATKIFGEKLGAIIGAVVALVTLQVGTGLMNGMSLASTWGNLMSAANLIQLTNAVGTGVSGYIQASAMQTQQKTEELLETYNTRSKEISELFQQNIGYDRGVIDPMSLTDTMFGNFSESQAMFLSRTLMTGTDIAEMSMDMLNNFADYTLNLERPDNG
jgi:hypothetical protein